MRLPRTVKFQAIYSDDATEYVSQLWDRLINSIEVLLFILLLLLPPHPPPSLRPPSSSSSCCCSSSCPPSTAAPIVG
jgi:hypothetical protein